jgi:hypothetical protein
MKILLERAAPEGYAEKMLLEESETEVEGFCQRRRIERTEQSLMGQ